MFSKWIRLLLNVFDICGFRTEIESLPGTSKTSDRIFVLHIFWALATIVIVIAFSLRTRALNGVLPYTVNTTLHNFCGVFTYWVVIIESFAQRNIQQKFWHIYWCIHADDNCLPHGKSYFKVYLIKTILYFAAVVPIDCYLMYYFLSFVENYFLFRLAYLFFVILYQTRIFYYLFYVELIKYELIGIKNAIKNIAPAPNDRGGKAKPMKLVYKHYSQICELNDCINHIFGWSNFVTILYCFGLLLTDANWAYSSFADRPMAYIYGKN